MLILDEMNYILSSKYIKYWKKEEQIRPEQHLGLGDMDTLLPEMFFKMSKSLVSIITQTIQEAYRLSGIYDKDFNDGSKINIKSNIFLEKNLCSFVIKNLYRVFCFYRLITIKISIGYGKFKYNL